MNIQDAIQIFQSTSGISSSHLSLFVRSILCGSFLLWAAWNVYGQIKVMHTNHQDIYDLPVTILRVLLLCSLVIILIFVN
jgi:integrating conjugative element protein (TIGR03758 family)